MRENVHHGFYVTYLDNRGLKHNTLLFGVSPINWMMKRVELVDPVFVEWWTPIQVTDSELEHLRLIFDIPKL